MGSESNSTRNRNPPRKQLFWEVLGTKIIIYYKSCGRHSFWGLGSVDHGLQGPRRRVIRTKLVSAAFTDKKKVKSSTTGHGIILINLVR